MLRLPAMIHAESTCEIPIEFDDGERPTARAAYDVTAFARESDVHLRTLAPASAPSSTASPSSASRRA